MLFQPHWTHQTELPPNSATGAVAVLVVSFQAIAVHVGGGKQGSFAKDMLEKGPGKVKSTPSVSVYLK